MLNPSLYDSVPYDPVKDFEPISQMLVSPNVIVVDALDRHQNARRTGSACQGRAGQDDPHQRRHRHHATSHIRSC